MKSFRPIVTFLGLLTMLMPFSVFAAKAEGPKARLFAKYDTNHNGVIDGTEIDALRKDYASDPNGELKRFDKNKDGELDDEEIAAIKPPGSKHRQKTDKEEKPSE